MIQHTLRCAALVLCMGAAASSFASDPLPGMWSFDGELTGKPGRGFQIDTQGSNVLIVSYFGYRADGSALFLQASGARASDGSFSADLVEYRGGTVLGGPHQDGEQAQVVGRLVATFDSSSTGSITLPGEAPRVVKRFQYVDNSQRFNNDFSANRYDRFINSSTPERTSLRITAQGGIFNMVEGDIPTTANGSTDARVCYYEGTYVLAGAGLQSQGVVRCNNESETTFRTDELLVTRDGFFHGRIYVGNSNLPMTYQGYCNYPGAVFTGFNPRCTITQ